MNFKAKLISVLIAIICFTACQEKASKEQLAQEFVKAAFPSPSAEFVQMQNTITQADESGDADKISEVQEQSNRMVADALIALCGKYVDNEKLTGNGLMATKLLRMQIFAASRQYSYTVQEVTTKQSNDTNVSYEAKIAVSIPDGVEDYFQNTGEVSEIVLFGNIQFNKDDKIDFFTVEQKSK